MAKKFGDPNDPDFSRLLSVLLTSGLQSSNNALYQVLVSLIKNVNKSIRSLRSGLAILTTIINGSSSSPGVVTATYLTVANETILLINSRRLLAGINVTFDDTVAGIRTINVTSGASTGGYWTPLTDGDPDETDLIFAAGESIAVFVPVP